MSIDETINIKVGQTASVERGWFSMDIIFMYNGMPNENVFSMARQIADFQYSPPLFYPTDMEEISLQGKTFTVVKVTPLELTLSYRK